MWHRAVSVQQLKTALIVKNYTSFLHDSLTTYSPCSDNTMKEKIKILLQFFCTTAALFFPDKRNILLLFALFYSLFLSLQSAEKFHCIRI